MNIKLSKESLALLKQNAITEDVFFAWLAAKYQFTYKATGWTFCAFIEFFFTYACWGFHGDPRGPWFLAILFWLALNLCILLPIGLGTGLFGGQRKKHATKEPIIQAMHLSYTLYYTDPKKLARFSPARWEKIRGFATVR